MIHLIHGVGSQRPDDKPTFGHELTKRLKKRGLDTKEVYWSQVLDPIERKALDRIGMSRHLPSRQFLAMSAMDAVLWGFYRTELESCVANQVKDDAPVIVAHPLGSVIVWDTIGRSIYYCKALVLIGSPVQMFIDCNLLHPIIIKTVPVFNFWSATDPVSFPIDHPAVTNIQLRGLGPAPMSHSAYWEDKRVAEKIAEVAK